jgi:cytochrome c-type biogenesis protein CcmH/NrfG
MIIKQKTWVAVAGAALLTVAFASGYWLGINTRPGTIAMSNSLTSSDMEHAFGSVQSTLHEAVTQEPAVMSLSGLVAGLEKKVAANPENIDQQLLLAQTYNELDNREKSLKLLHALNKQAALNPQVKITLATILMTSTDKQELQQASRLFDEAIKLKPEIASMARLYKGEIQVKLDNMK